MAKARGEASAHPNRVRYVMLPKPTGKGFVLGPMAAREPLAWVKTPDVRERLAIGLKRRQGVPVLAKVAKKTQRPKLVRLKLREPWELAP